MIDGKSPSVEKYIPYSMISLKYYGRKLNVQLTLKINIVQNEPCTELNTNIHK